MRNATYLEDYEHARAREAERAMVFTALRQRRARPTSGGVFVAVLRLLGAI